MEALPGRSKRTTAGPPRTLGHTQGGKEGAEPVVAARGPRPSCCRFVHAVQVVCGWSPPGSPENPQTRACTPSSRSALLTVSSRGAGGARSLWRRPGLQALLPLHPRTRGLGGTGTRSLHLNENVSKQVPLLENNETNALPLKLKFLSEFLSILPPAKSLLLLLAPRPMFAQEANCLVSNRIFPIWG